MIAKLSPIDSAVALKPGRGCCWQPFPGMERQRGRIREWNKEQQERIFQLCFASCWQWVSHYEEPESGRFLLWEQQPVLPKYILHCSSPGLSHLLFCLFYLINRELVCFGLPHSDFTQCTLLGIEKCYSNRCCSHEVESSMCWSVVEIASQSAASLRAGTLLHPLTVMGLNPRMAYCSPCLLSPFLDYSWGSLSDCHPANSWRWERLEWSGGSEGPCVFLSAVFSCKLFEKTALFPKKLNR